MTAEIAWTFAMQDDDSGLPPFEQCHESPAMAKADARAYAASLRGQGLSVGRTYLVRVERSVSYLSVGQIDDAAGAEPAPAGVPVEAAAGGPLDGFPFVPAHGCVSPLPASMLRQSDFDTQPEPTAGLSQKGDDRGAA